MGNKSAAITYIDVFWFIPNLIGYIRVVLAAIACFSMFYEYPMLMFLSYGASEFLDVADGYYARKFNQCSKFGEVLDMVTDRCTTTVLITYLCQLYPRLALPFCLLISLDISSHYMQMYSQLITGKTNHKQMDSQAHWVLKAYYTNRKVLFAFCLGNEAFFLFAYMLQYPDAFPYALSLMLAVIAFPICVIKNVINVVQLYESAKDLAKLDAQQISSSSSSSGKK